jgi:UDP-galactopyranose mutase
MYDLLVVGSGLYGAVFAQQAREAGKSVLVLEKRKHTGGNCHSYVDDESRVIVHQYGTHVFHTSDDKVWAYINRFTAFNTYRHRILTTHRQRVYPMPINLGTVNAFFGLSLTPSELAPFLADQRTPIANPANLEEKALSLVGRPLYEAFIKGYTLKQWGVAPTQLPASILARLPVRHSYNADYFDDRYQGVPLEGYAPIFRRLLDGVDVETGIDYLDDRDYWRRRARTILYTGPVDRYFDYAAGRLGWRSVRFELERAPVPDWQGISIMNYADVQVPCTRIHEFKHLHPERRHTPASSLIMREYALRDDHAPCYPINTAADRARFAEYKTLCAKEPGVLFGGRLAEYRYYDMDQVIAAALKKSRLWFHGHVLNHRGTETQRAEEAQCV